MREHCRPPESDQLVLRTPHASITICDPMQCYPTSILSSALSSALSIVLSSALCSALSCVVSGFLSVPGICYKKQYQQYLLAAADNDSNYIDDYSNYIYNSQQQQYISLFQNSLL